MKFGKTRGRFSDFIKEKTISFPAESVRKIKSKDMTDKDGKKENDIDKYQSFEIHLRNGRVLDKKLVWEEDDLYKYQMAGSSIGLPKKSIRKIIATKMTGEKVVIFENEDQSDYEMKDANKSLQRISKTSQQRMNAKKGGFGSYSIGQRVKMKGMLLTFIGCGRQTIVTRNSVSKGSLGSYFRGENRVVYRQNSSAGRLWRVKPGWVPQKFEDCSGPKRVFQKIEIVPAN